MVVVGGNDTALPAPLVEKLLFRDYLETRPRTASIAAPSPHWRKAMAVAVAAALFAALHDRLTDVAEVFHPVA